MKKYLLIVILFMALKAAAQQEYMIDTSFSVKKSSFREKTKLPTSKVNTFKISPVDIFISNFLMNAELRLLYERMLFKQHSILIGGSYEYNSVITSIYNIKAQPKVKLNGYRVQGAYRYYILKKQSGPKGLYIGPHISFQEMYIKNTGSADYAQIRNLFAVLSTGYQIVAKNGFTIDFCGGLGYNRTWYIETQYSNNQPTTVNYSKNLNKIPLKIMAQINLGYSF